MGNKLLVRSYNVGCGDCTYVRIPHGTDGFHILIDSGSKESAKSGVLKRVLKHMEDSLLPSDVSGKKRLDLIVVTHRHEDHINGFDPEYFTNIAIKNIWITAAMDASHTQAKKSLALHEYASASLLGLVSSGAAFSPELEELATFYGIRNTGATTALTETFPQANGIQPAFVFAGQTSADYGISIDNAKLTVLAPEKDIDGYYLGKEADETLRGLLDGAEHFRKHSNPVSKTIPLNICTRDFRTLQSRLLHNGLAFAVDDSSIQNNVSTVLLIEWKKRRLLFVGDVEWEEKYREGKKKNGSWNVMWKERKKYLSKPLDFLKIGHHGSRNATPWNRHEAADDEVNQILDAILPAPAQNKKANAQCVVSTKRKQYDTIPDGELLVELGRRVRNTKRYLKDFVKANPDFDPDNEIYNYSVMKQYASEPEPREVGDKGWLDKKQPLRTDMEFAGRGAKELPNIVQFIDIEIDP